MYLTYYDFILNQIFSSDIDVNLRLVVTCEFHFTKMILTLFFNLSELNLIDVTWVKIIKGRNSDAARILVRIERLVQQKLFIKIFKNSIKFA